MRKLIREELSPQLLTALVDLVERGGKDVGTRVALGMELAERFFGKHHSSGWAGLAVDAEAKASAAETPTTTDLTEELRTARQRHADLVKQVEACRATGEQPSATLHRQELEAADLVRRLVRAQAAVNPGGEAKGDFSISVEIAADPAIDADVPNLVADKQAPPPRDEPELKPNAPQEPKDPFAEDDDG